MPIIDNSPFFKSCDELFEGRAGTPWDATGKREYTRRFRVIVRMKEMAEISVMLCPHLPLPGSPYVIAGIEYDLNALALRFRISQEHPDDWQNWIVEVTYTTELPPGGLAEVLGRAGNNIGAQNNPELEPTDIDWDYEVMQIALPRDLNKKAFLNSAQMPFTPAPTFDVGVPVLSLSRNENGFNVLRANKFAFALNENEFLGYPPNTVQCLPPKAQLTHRGRLQFFRVNYRLRFSRKLFDGEWISWQPKLLNVGMSRLDRPDPLDPNTWIPVTIKRNGIPLNQPELLDLQGNPIPYQNVAGQPHRDPIYIDFKVYPTANFNDLLRRGLGGTLQGPGGGGP